MPANPPPVVFLPGVMGSRLFFPNSDKFWDPDSTLRMSAWLPIPFFRTADELRLQLGVAEPAVVLDGPLGRGWDGVPQSFYATFLQGLQAGPPARTVYAMGYDWRQDMWVTAELVRGRIQEILRETGSGQLDVVTHSMGGLVLRAALARTPGLKDQIRRVVHVCQPVFGAVVLYRRFFTGLVPQLDGSPFAPADIAFRLILGSDAVEFAGNMSGLPGPMQLLPNARYPVDASVGSWNPSPLGDGTIYDLYANPPRPPSLIPDHLESDVLTGLARRLDEVRAFHGKLVVQDEQGLLLDIMHPQTWAICGIGLDTDMGISFEGSTAEPRRRPEGDGTVPFPSGAALFGGRGIAFHPTVNPATRRQFVVSKVDHAGAMTDPTVMQCVMSILR